MACPSECIPIPIAPPKKGCPVPTFRRRRPKCTICTFKFPVSVWAFVCPSVLCAGQATTFRLSSLSAVLRSFRPEELPNERRSPERARISDGHSVISLTSGVLLNGPLLAPGRTSVPVNFRLVGPQKHSRSHSPTVYTHPSDRCLTMRSRVAAILWHGSVPPKATKLRSMPTRLCERWHFIPHMP